VLDDPLARMDIQRSEYVVEQYGLRPRVHGSGKGDSRTLAARECDALLSNLCVVTSWEEFHILLECACTHHYSRC
jgi:hypothetical protein